MRTDGLTCRCAELEGVKQWGGGGPRMERKTQKKGSQAVEERVLHPLGSLVPRPGQGGREGGEGGGTHGGTLPNLERVQIKLAVSIHIVTEISALI